MGYFYWFSVIPKKMGVKEQVLHSQAREIITNISEFTEKEAKEGIQILFKHFRSEYIFVTSVQAKLALKEEWVKI